MGIYTLEALAKATGLHLLGDATLTVDSVAPPASAGPNDLALAMNESYADDLRASSAKAAVVWDGADLEDLGLQAALVASQPRVALAHVTAAFQHATDVSPGIHPTAHVDPSAEIGPQVSIGPFSLVGAGTSIGAGSVVAGHCAIGSEVTLGPGALLHAGVRIGARCRIGAQFIAQPNAVIGADGFSFEPPQRGAVEAVRATGEVSATNTMGFLRIHSLAAVEIGDDVEIGALTSIDRGTISPTRVGSGTKIDNQVQIGHNVQIGSMCLICAQVGIAGSARLGDRVVLGGKVGIGDHLKLGSDVVCAAGTLVASNVPDKSVMMGAPAVARDHAVKQFLALRRLPRVIEQVGEIRKKLGL